MFVGQVDAQSCQPVWNPWLADTDMEFLVIDLLVGDIGEGYSLYMIGESIYLEGMEINGLARWDGQNWHPLGAATDGADAVGKIWDDGSGPSLFVGGTFPTAGGKPAANIARWDGHDWYPLGSGLDEPAVAMEPFDPDGPGPLKEMLYLGGSFEYAGGTQCSGIAAWDGQNYHNLGVGLGGVFDAANAVRAFDPDGPGPKPLSLFVGGEFYAAGDKTAFFIAIWDGTDWFPAGQGFNESVDCLAIYDDDGPGPHAPSLYASGLFSGPYGETWSAHGDGSFGGVARWNGSDWEPVGQGMRGFWYGNEVFKLAQFDRDGDGPEPPSLFAAGTFSFADGNPADFIARWDGQAWHGLEAGGLDDAAGSLVADQTNSPLGPALYVGGRFTTAGGTPSHNLAQYACPRCRPDLTGDGALDLFDFLAFVNLFNAADPRADFDTSGDLNLFDFLAFTNAFNAGC
jgi:hypothetical protein